MRRATSLVFMFSAPELVFDGTEASEDIFMFCAPRLVFGVTEGVRSHFHVFRARTHVLRYQWRRVSFLSFRLLDLFLTVPWSSGPDFMLCAPGLIFRGTEGVRSHFMCCAPDSFSAETRASAPVFMFYARTHFLRYRRRWVPF
jgi:hypothetical protein